MVNVLATGAYVLIGNEIWKEDENSAYWWKKSYAYVVEAEKDMETKRKEKQVLVFLIILGDESHILGVLVFFILYIA